jgi:flavin reductase ActVB
MPISSDVYKQLGRAAARPVSVLLTFDAAKDRAVGLTVSSFATLSLDPPLVMVAIERDAESYAALVSSRAFGVSVLHAGQAAIAALFATKRADKTDNTRLEVGVLLQVPLIPDALAHVECITTRSIVSGDHALLIGSVEAARMTVREALLYQARRYGTFTPLESSDALALSNWTGPEELLAAEREGGLLARRPSPAPPMPSLQSAASSTTGTVAATCRLYQA